LQTSLGCDSFNENLVGFIEINAKTMDLWVLGTIAIFAAFTMMVPLFSALFHLRVRPILRVVGKRRIHTTRTASSTICLILTGPYWIVRVMMCKFKAKYKSKLLTDIAIFFAVFIVSEYLKWTYSLLYPKSLLSSRK